MGKILRAPTRKSVLATATALTASYAKVGSAINIEGMTGITLHCKQTTGSVNALVKPYFSITGDAPTANTSMYQYVTNTAGTEIELTTLDGEYAVHPISGASGKYVLFYAKNSSGTDGTLTAFVTGYVPTVEGRIVNRLNTSILTATEQAASYADVGTAATEVWGYNDLCLHVYESGGTDNALIKVFTGHTGSAPTATTAMNQYTAAAGTEIELKVLMGERASLVLPGLTAKWIMLQAKDAGDGSGHATLAIDITGNAISL